MDSERISLIQVTMILVVSRLSLTLIFFGSNPDIRQDVWWQAFLAALLIIPAAWLLDKLWQRFPNRRFTEVCTLVLGPVAGRLVLLGYAAALFVTLAVSLRMTGEVFAFAFLPRTPIAFIMGVVGLLAAWGARAGIEVIGRATQVVFPLLIASVLGIVLLLSKEIDFSQLWPPFILHTGPWPHLADAIGVVGRTWELLWIGLAIPLIAERQRTLHTVVVASLWVGAIWLFMGVAIVGVLGPDYAPIYFPFFSVAREVSIADFLERVEGILLGIWLLGMFLRAALFLWSAAICTADLCGLKEYRPLVIPLGGLGVGYGIAQAESMVELADYLRFEVLTPYAVTFVLAIPWLILAVAALRGLGRTRRVARAGAQGATRR